MNPALRHHFHQLYGLRLPESVDLRETSAGAFHRELDAHDQGQRTRRDAATRGQTRDPTHPSTRPATARTISPPAKFARAGKANQGGLQLQLRSREFPAARSAIVSGKNPAEPLAATAAAGGSPQPRMTHMVTAEARARDGAEDLRPARRAVGEIRTRGTSTFARSRIGNFNYRKMSLVRDYGALHRRGNGQRVV